MGKPAPTIEASIEMAASPAEVWQVVRDVRRVREWSPQVVRTFVWGRPRGESHRGVGVGAMLTSLNRQGAVFWPTTSRIGLYEPDHAIGWTTLENGSRWSYQLIASERGTRVIERREQPHGITPLSVVVQQAAGGVDAFTAAMSRGIQLSLQDLKQIVERG